MGVVPNYADIRFKRLSWSVSVAMAASASEMLVRCGVGKLIIFDYDKVELANMNRLFYTPDQCGMSKVAAARKSSSFINPDVEIEDYNSAPQWPNARARRAHHADAQSQRCHFMRIDRISQGRLSGGAVDLVLSCVDNFQARMSINQACNELGQTWIESGVSRGCGLRHIQLIKPGELACFECAPPLIVATGVDEKTLKREGVCAASLPTTMGITAGFLRSERIKIHAVLWRGRHVSRIHRAEGHFPKMALKPNPGHQQLVPQAPKAYQKKKRRRRRRTRRRRRQRRWRSRSPRRLPTSGALSLTMEAMMSRLRPQAAAAVAAVAGAAAACGRGDVCARCLVAAEAGREEGGSRWTEEGGVDLGDLMAQLQGLQK